jgi:hypothetical protein
MPVSDVQHTTSLPRETSRGDVTSLLLKEQFPTSLSYLASTSAHIIPLTAAFLPSLRRMASRHDCEGVTVCEQNLALQLAETNAYEYKQQDTSEYNVENDRLNAVSKPEPGLERHSRIDFYPHRRILTAGMASGERQKRPEEVQCRRMASAASGCFARYRMVTLRAGVCRRWSSCCIRAPGTCW